MERTETCALIYPARLAKWRARRQFCAPSLRQPYRRKALQEPLPRAADGSVCLAVCFGIRRAPKLAQRSDFADWSDMRLLIVEDNEELAELLAKGLQTAGYESDTLSNIEEA